jgi:hypothetical protein
MLPVKWEKIYNTVQCYLWSGKKYTAPYNVTREVEKNIQHRTILPVKWKKIYNTVQCYPWSGKKYTTLYNVTREVEKNIQHRTMVPEWSHPAQKKFNSQTVTKNIQHRTNYPWSYSAEEKIQFPDKCVSDQHKETIASMTVGEELKYSMSCTICLQGLAVGTVCHNGDNGPSHDTAKSLRDEDIMNLIICHYHTFDN